MCSILNHPNKLTISRTLGQSVKKLVLRRLNYYVIKRYIESISHAMIMAHNLPHKINHIIHKDIVSILRGMNMLCDILRRLELHNMNVKLLSPNQK